LLHNRLYVGYNQPSTIKESSFVAYATERGKVMQKSEQSEQNEDLRVRRTRKLIQEALIELTIEKKTFSAITIRDITERAMVNRSTFYRHYLDKCDLVEQYVNDVFALTAVADANMEKDNYVEEDPPRGLLNLVEHIQQYAEFYRVMFGPEGDAGFVDDFRGMIEQRFRYLLSLAPNQNDPRIPSIDMRVSYIAAGDIGVITWWLENDQPCSAVQLARWISQLTRASAGLQFRPPDSRATARRDHAG
jgi:AcrR family transcriptional regulator